MKLIYYLEQTKFNIKLFLMAIEHWFFAI